MQRLGLQGYMSTLNRLGLHTRQAILQTPITVLRHLEASEPELRERYYDGSQGRRRLLSHLQDLLATGRPGPAQG